MRSFFVSMRAAPIALCVGALPAVAQLEPPPAANAPVDETVELQYRDAVALLRNGRKFEVAITKLRNAVKQAPNNAAYHLARGCALANRAVSLADAARQAAEYTGKLSDYKDATALWGAAQKRPDDVLYKQPRRFHLFFLQLKMTGKRSR